ncbi:ABC transporter substrate-binding protein [Metallumcola ferriviriculae]|uniref:ABC transporter substrate-binding protein n=1 Tax=Metallumcola ferriviriculae TaxID=3039180 RepID=A0AAU0URZ4_9FIRM|nr:ABC transporter substrate-binding protein [Desulfitibacteraceae bacterium MK1]
MSIRLRFAAVILSLLLVIGLVAGCGGGSTTESADKGDQEKSTPKQEEPAKEENTEPIKLGGIFDITGGTGDVGAPYAEGATAYVKWLNENGGVNGRQIDLEGIDYAYKIPQAVEAYKKLVYQQKAPAILGWGTGDTEAMVPFISKDKIPYISGSLSETLLTVADHPYNFMVAASYSDQARVILKYIKDNAQEEQPKVALIYNDTGFGKSPIADAEAFAKEIGVEIVDKEVVDLKALDATSQLLNMDKAGANYAIIQETSNATATILKDAKKLGLDTKFFGLNWTADEISLKLMGDAAEGYIGVIPFAFPYEDVAGMKDVEEGFALTGKSLDELNQKHIQGWFSAMVMMEGMKRAGDDVTGENIKKGLESMNEFSSGDLAAPVSFSADSHRGSSKVKLYQVTDGQWTPITDWIGYK